MQNKTIVNMNEDCQFIKDLEKQTNQIEGAKFALYNLAVCVGQVKMFSKGIKPSRHWRLKDVKNYFGLSGGTDKILAQLEQLQTIINDINLSNERGDNA
tara:strand:+ start:738 stop:1034 length:297 start_codon:yes stop_codon:yes gene_type:complete